MEFIRLDVLLAIPSFHVPRPHSTILLRFLGLSNVIRTRPSEERTRQFEVLLSVTSTLWIVPFVGLDDECVRLFVGRTEWSHGSVCVEVLEEEIREEGEGIVLEFVGSVTRRVGFDVVL